MGKTINVHDYTYVDIDVDVDGYKDEFLEACTDEEILEEAKKRHLINSCPDRGDMIMSTAGEFKRHLCDLLELGYHTSDEDILYSIKANL